MNQFVLRDRQRTKAINKVLLRRIATEFLAVLPGIDSHELAVHLVCDEEMTNLNETFLNHVGPTDVITFNHIECASTSKLHGEIFICVDEAMRNARSFHTIWQKEIIRYFVHGCLHLQGFDDKTAADRRRMKRVENKWVRILDTRFALRQLLIRKTVRQ